MHSPEIEKKNLPWKTVVFTPEPKTPHCAPWETPDLTFLDQNTLIYCPDVIFEIFEILVKKFVNGDLNP